MPQEEIGYVVSPYAGNENQKVSIENSSIMIPTEQQSRYAKTVQTHNAVNIAATTGFSDSAYIDTNGFSDIVINTINDASTNSAVHLLWSTDGITQHGGDWNISSGTTQQKSVSVPTKLRYVKVRLLNTDAAAHTMSAWAYLKV